MVPAASLMSATELAIGSARFFRPVISFSKFDDRLVELLLVLDGGVQHGVQVADHLSDGLVAVGQRGGQLAPSDPGCR